MPRGDGNNMNIILLTEDDFIGRGGGIVKITGRRFEHISKILRPEPGDMLSVGILGGKIGKARVISLNGSSVEMEVTVTYDPPNPGKTKLVLALPRPIALKRILTHVTSLGVKYITLLHSTRVEKSYWRSPALADAGIRQQLMMGLEQAGDTILPQVSMKMEFRRFVRDELPGLTKGSQAFVGNVDGKDPLPCDIKGEVTLVIGPEGGFLPYEVKLLEEAGCKCVNFGRRILRVETAVVAALARIGL